MIDAIDITTSQRKTILEMLKRYLPDTEVWAYGSRVKWTSRPESDLDMVVFASPDQKRQVSDLKETLEESDLPFRVDVFEWDEVPEGFRENIEAEHVVLQEQSERSRVIGSEWKEHRLSDVIELIGGGTPKRSNADYWGGGIPWLSVKDFNNDQRHVFVTEETISDKGLNNSSTKMLQMGQIIISARGTVGALAQLAVPMAFNQSCYGITAKTECTHNDYLFYLLRYTVENLQRITHGAVFDTITKETFNHVTVSIPPLPDQRAIAHILGSLDDKIELNRQMNRTLEKMAQAIFKSWFIDFDPVKRNRELRRVNCENSKETFHENSPFTIHHSKFDSLFPDSFEDSELGEIPKGWEVKKLSEVCIQLRRGISPKYTDEDGILVLNQRCVRDHRLVLSNARRHDSSKRSVKGRFIKPGDMLVNSTGVGTLGRVSHVASLPEPAIVDSHVTVLRSDEAYYERAVFCLNIIHLESEIQAMGEGSTGQTELSRKVLGDKNVLVPERAIQKKYDSFVSPSLKKMDDNERQSNILASLRDTLLPKLISGELRVPDAEKFIEETGI